MIWRKAEPTTTNRKKPSSSGPTVVAFLSLCGAHASSEHGSREQPQVERSRKGESERAEPSGQRAHRLALGGVSATLQDVRVELLLRLLHPPLRRARLQNSGRSASGVRTRRLLLRKERKAVAAHHFGGGRAGGGLAAARCTCARTAAPRLSCRAQGSKKGAEQPKRQPTGSLPKQSWRLKAFPRPAGGGALSQRGHRRGGGRMSRRTAPGTKVHT